MYFFHWTNLHDDTPLCTFRRILSPFSVSNDDKNVQRIMIRPAKILFYNRVAKTGSQSMMALLRAIAKKNDFVVESVPKVYIT